MAENKGKVKITSYLINYIVVFSALFLAYTLGYRGMLDRSFMNLITQVCYYVILAVSLNLVVGFLGELSLGHAGFMCIGAYLGGFIANILYSNGMPRLLILIIAMVSGGVIAAFFGLLIGLPALRLRGDYLAIVTLAFGEIVRTIFKNIKLFGGAMGLSTNKYGVDLFVPSLIVILIMLFIVQNLIKSKHGRAITAIRDNEIASRAMGINVTFYKLLVFVVSAFFAGIAGVIYALHNTPVVYKDFSYNYSIEILVMVVLGGMGNVSGSMIAATLITCINVFLKNRLSGDMAAIKDLVYALILIITVIFNNAPALKGIKERLYVKKGKRGV